MKKIFVFLFSFFITLNVNAKTYYSEYSDFKIVDKMPEKSDIVDLQIEKKYLIYKENKTTAFYPSYMNIDNMNKTSETKIEESSWLDNKPSEMKGRQIISKRFYEYQNMKKIKYIKLNNLVGTNTKVALSEILLLNDKDKIDCEIKINNKKIDALKDKNINTYSFIKK